MLTPPKRQREIKYLKMLEDINNLVGGDFGMDIEYKARITKTPFTKQESLEMVNIITKVFQISHQIHCVACLERKHL